MQEPGGDGAGPALRAGEHGESELDPAEFVFQVGQHGPHPLQGFGVGDDEHVEVAPAVLVLAAGSAPRDGQQVHQRVRPGQAVEEFGEVRLQVHGQAQGVDRHRAGLVLGPLAGQSHTVQPPLQLQAAPVVADDLLRDGGDLVGAPCALDEVAVENVLGSRRPSLCTDSAGGVQVGDGELGAEHPGELDCRVEVVQ